MKKLTPLKLTALITLAIFIALAIYPAMIWWEWKEHQAYAARVKAVGGDDLNVEFTTDSKYEYLDKHISVFSDYYERVQGVHRAYDYNLHMPLIHIQRNTDMHIEPSLFQILPCNCIRKDLDALADGGSIFVLESAHSKYVQAAFVLLPPEKTFSDCDHVREFIKAPQASVYIVQCDKSMDQSTWTNICSSIRKAMMSAQAVFVDESESEMPEER